MGKRFFVLNVTVAVLFMVMVLQEVTVTVLLTTTEEG